MVDSKESYSSVTKQDNRCEYSDEAKRVGLDDFLQEAQDKYYALNPDKIASRPGVKPDEIRKKYRCYDPSPSNIKKITDAAVKIAKDLEEMPIDKEKLTLREKRAIAQLAHWGKHGFPFMVPYLYNYYVADWMMGGDIFCWNPMCFILIDMQSSLKHFKPSTVNEMETLRDKFKEVGTSFDQFVANMRLGVEAGMVRSIDECKAGLDGLKNRYTDVAFNGATGIYQSRLLKPFLESKFLSEMKADQLTEWKAKSGKSVNESLHEFILDHVGKPIDRMLRFIEDEYIQHCVPENIATGLSSLPLKYIYVNGSQTNTETTQKLPSGETLKGLDSYLKLLQHFTTNSQTPENIYKLGEEMLSKLYVEVLELTKTITKETNADNAKNKFIKIINASDQFYSVGDIPANESDSNAHKVCISDEKAAMYCPKRTAAMKNWFSYTKEILATMDYEIADLFHVTGPYQSTPGCPIKLQNDFNPSSAVPFYIQSDARCSRVASYNMPFFLKRPGPRYESKTMAAHEARPGHHTQVQGYTERFTDTCGGPIGWIASSTIYLSFSEGWALYSENPLIPKYTKMYEADPISKYGMLKWQVWRALRLMMDTGLHVKGKRRDWAKNLFAQYAWDTSDVADKEITRYLSVPGQAVTYMLGQLVIMKLKKEAEDELKDNFNIKDFHYQILRQGPSPLSYIEDSIRKYISCAKDKNQKGCDEVLEPPKPASVATGNQFSNVFNDAGISPWVV